LTFEPAATLYLLLSPATRLATGSPSVTRLRTSGSSRTPKGRPGAGRLRPSSTRARNRPLRWPWVENGNKSRRKRGRLKMMWCVPVTQMVPSGLRMRHAPGSHPTLKR
jgi:hypothetical protein